MKTITLEKHRFITHKLWVDNTSSKIEETIIEFSKEFDVELHEAEETVNYVLSMRP